MNADPTAKLRPGRSPGKGDFEVPVPAEWASLSLRELLGALLSSLGEAERKSFLAQHPDDLGNGSYARQVGIGSIPVEFQVPRTRSGDFRPAILPPHYQRTYPEEMQAMLMGLLASSKSINAAKDALRRMGLPASERDLDAVAREFIEELDLRNSRPLSPDLIALYLDAKVVDVRDGERIHNGCIYVAVGLGLDGRKRIFLAQFRRGHESLENWKAILRNLCERGLRRVRIVIHDDFSGLLGVTQSLFPRSDIQLCIVHMQRNARAHLNKEDGQAFKARLQSIKNAYTREAASHEFDELCQTFRQDYPTFIDAIARKRAHYLAFLQFPSPIRKTLSTTNAVEAVNGQLERLRINSGGYFQSEENLKLKLGLTLLSLEDKKWKKTNGTITTVLPDLVAEFHRHFEEED